MEERAVITLSRNTEKRQDACGRLRCPSLACMVSVTVARVLGLNCMEQVRGV